MRSVQSNEQKNTTIIVDGREDRLRATRRRGRSQRNPWLYISSVLDYTCGSRFSWFEQDIWTYISRFLDGQSLVMLGATNKWFHNIIMEGAIWRLACLRDFQVPELYSVSSSWIKIYDSAYVGSHSYLFHHSEMHIGSKKY